MSFNANWIWLDNNIYPDMNKSAIYLFDKENLDYKYIIAEFQKKKNYNKKIKNIIIEISADVRFWLYVNGEFQGVGPVCAGGDYGNYKPMPYTYYNTYNLEINSNELDIYAMVQNKPTVQCDMSQGKCGFIMACRVVFDDNSEEMLYTDETWLARVNNQRKSALESDFTVENGTWHNAMVVFENCWNLKKSSLLNLSMEEIRIRELESIVIETGERRLHMNITRENCLEKGCFYKIDLSEKISLDENNEVTINNVKKAITNKTKVISLS